MRLAVAGGGTGGHIYPAVSVIDSLLQAGEDVSVLWLGVVGNPEQTLSLARGWEFAPVRAEKVRGSGWRTPVHAALSFSGALGASRALRRFGAQVVMATGGYVSVPGALGAKLAGIPVLLFLPDASPGWAIRLVKRLADASATTSEWANRSLGGRATVTGYPVRQAFFTCIQEGCRRDFGLDDRPVVLVLGGSSGARQLNRAVLRWMGESDGTVQVIHVSGTRDHEMVRAAALEAGLGPESGYHLYPYLEELPRAMAAADLVVSRAGAASLGELSASGKPAILVPGLFAGGHQKANAAYLAEQGAAVVVEDGEVESRLGLTVAGLLGDPVAMAEMAARARGLARPQAASELGGILKRLSRGGFSDS